MQTMQIMQNVQIYAHKSCKSTCPVQGTAPCKPCRSAGGREGAAVPEQPAGGAPARPKGPRLQHLVGRITRISWSGSRWGGWVAGWVALRAWRLQARPPKRARIPIGAQGGCTLLRLADFCGASRMMLAKIRALRQISFGCFVRRTRRMRTARKKRCAIPLTRSKELFQPDARSDLLRFGSRAPPWSLREGRESRGGREGESKPPPSPSGPAERKTVKAQQRPLFVPSCMICMVCMVSIPCMV